MFLDGRLSILMTISNEYLSIKIQETSRRLGWNAYLTPPHFVSVVGQII